MPQLAMSSPSGTRTHQGFRLDDAPAKPVRVAEAEPEPASWSGQSEATPGRFDDARLTAIGLLEETVSGLEARMGPQLAEHGLSLLEFEVLLRLGRSPGCQLRMADLATQVSLSASGLTRVVDRLERTGLVIRRACDSDRRGTFATLTDAGATRLGEALPGHLEVLDTWLIGALDDARREGMLDGLRRVRDHVNPGALAGATGGVTHRP